MLSSRVRGSWGSGGFPPRPRPAREASAHLTGSPGWHEGKAERAQMALPLAAGKKQRGQRSGRQWFSKGGPRPAEPVTCALVRNAGCQAPSYLLFSTSGDGNRKLVKPFGRVLSTIKFENSCCRETKDSDLRFGGRAGSLAAEGEDARWMRR